MHASKLKAQFTTRDERNAACEAWDALSEESSLPHLYQERRFLGTNPMKRV
jgi:hypothetical protein